jgi:glycosyltransferase involved in cell wall biosynthesis
VGEPDNAREFIASNHVMIAPLFAGSGIRIKIIEAMSAGRPVVATPVAVAGLPVENGRELAVASDPATFTAAIVRLLEEPELRASTGERALRLVKERYDNTVITARLLEFYKKLRHGS